MHRQSAEHWSQIQWSHGPRSFVSVRDVSLALADVVGLTPSNHLATQKLPHILDFERSTSAPIEQELAEVARSCQEKAMNHTRVSDRCLLPWSSSRSTLVVAVIGLPRDLHPGFFTLLKGRV